MAGNTVTLTFVGNTKDLEKGIGSATRKTESFAATVNRASKVAAISSAAMAAGVAGGAVTAGLALAALPLAFGGIGIAAAAQSEKVKTAFTGLKDHVTKTMQSLAAPIEPVLLGIATKAKAAFDSLGPTLSSIFATSAPYIATFAGALISFVEGALPHFDAALKNLKPVFDAFSTGIAEMGPALGLFFENMSGGSQGAAGAITVLFDAVNWLLPALGSLLGFLADNANWLLPLAGYIGAVAGALKIVTIAQAAWNLALSLNPIGIVVILIAGLVAAFIWLWNNVEGFRNFFIGAWDTIKNAVSSAIGWVSDRVSGLISFFSSLPSRIGAIFSSVGSAISAPFRSAFEGIRSLWNSTVGRISFTIPDWVPGIGGRGFSMPKFHDGGIVPGVPGSETVALLQAGEKVIPKNKVGNDSGVSEIRFTGNTSDALATVIMKMIRTGQIQIR